MNGGVKNENSRAAERAAHLGAWVCLGAGWARRCGDAPGFAMEHAQRQIEGGPGAPRAASGQETEAARRSARPTPEGGPPRSAAYPGARFTPEGV